MKKNLKKLFFHEIGRRQKELDISLNEDIKFTSNEFKILPVRRYSKKEIKELEKRLKKEGKL